MNRNFKILSIFFFVFLFVLQSYDADAQRRRRSRTTETRTSESFSDNLWYGIHLGNFDFFNGSFSLSGKFATGYKMNERISVGLSTKAFFDILEVFNGPDLNLFSYGGGPFVRFKVAGGVYVHGEYHFSSYEDYNPINLTTNRAGYNYPLLGGGYESGPGPWTFGFQLLFVLDEDVKELIVKDIVEWWITFSYNF